MDVNSIIEFIEVCEPKFNRLSNGQVEMFTHATQRVKSNSVAELLEIGLNHYKNHGNKSIFRLLIEKYEIDTEENKNEL